MLYMSRTRLVMLASNSSFAAAYADGSDYGYGDKVYYSKVPKVHKACSKKAPRLTIANPVRNGKCSSLLKGLLSQ